MRGQGGWIETKPSWQRGVPLTYFCDGTTWRPVGSVKQSEGKVAVRILSRPRVPIPNQIRPGLETFHGGVRAVAAAWNLKIVGVVEVAGAKILFDDVHDAFVRLPAWRTDPVTGTISHLF